MKIIYLKQSWANCNLHCFLNDLPNFTRKIIFIKILFSLVHSHTYTFSLSLSLPFLLSKSFGESRFQRGITMTCSFNLPYLLMLVALCSPVRKRKILAIINLCNFQRASLFCNVSWQQHNINDNVVTKLQFFYRKKSFYQREKYQLVSVSKADAYTNDLLLWK